MNLVLRDPHLLSLLRDVHRILPCVIACCVSFRKYSRSARRCCHQCRFCRVSSSILDVASLISRVLASGYRELTVFVVLDNERQLYSTFVLDYIQSLYALVIQTCSQYGADCGLCIPNDAVGVLNPNTHNLTVLPVYDWRGMLDRASLSSVFSYQGQLRFISVKGAPYMCDDFYQELSERGYSIDPHRKLASCQCSSAVHRNGDVGTLYRFSSSESVTSNDTWEVIYEGSTVDLDRKSNSTSPCGEVDPICISNRHETLKNDDNVLLLVDDKSSYGADSQPKCDAPKNGTISAASRDPQDQSGRIENNAVHCNSVTDHYKEHRRVSPRFERSTSMPTRSAIKGDPRLTFEHLQKSASLRNPDDCTIISQLKEMDCLALYDPSKEGATPEIMSFDNVMCCGTFDCLHFGHKYLLLSAFLSCRRSIHIGITAPDAMLRSKSDYCMIQSLEKRREVVERYVSILQLLYGRSNMDFPCPTNISKGTLVMNYHNCDFFSYNTVPMTLRECSELSCHEFTSELLPTEPSRVSDRLYPYVTIFDLMDMYGPAGMLKESFALVISPESLPGAEKVNNLRRSKGLTVWPLLSAAFVLHPELDHRRKNVNKVASSWIRRSLKSIK
ncbi:uncharacterized protein BXIN_0438 [Babesia sp. Xinjiang]|uniref:uncharacterized protein n=1 Tax=Babesia sp. Xinjiang TaxID=462227 RepID=UPI000A22F3AC|nr:uncharacterized protein BXIN_0438 [Babesia sp. Xinjiang]ORM41045.1 hypothetical protein BXIN_0438 [Babesia sp. Xinjiang]